MRKVFKKLEPRITNCSSYNNHLSNGAFKKELLNKLQSKEVL